MEPVGERDEPRVEPLALLGDGRKQARVVGPVRPGDEEPRRNVERHAYPPDVALRRDARDGRYRRDEVVHLG